MCISDFPAWNMKLVWHSHTVSFFLLTHKYTHKHCKSMALCHCLLWSLWLLLSSLLSRFAGFATNAIIVVISFAIAMVTVLGNKPEQNRRRAPFWDSSPPGGTRTQTSLLTRARRRIITAALLKSPAPSKGKACLSLMGAIMGLSDRGRVTLSGQAECTSFRPGRSGWHRGLGCVPHVWGLAPPAAISVPLCSQSH